MKVRDALDGHIQSLRWKLPEGKIVVVYEEDVESGKQLVLWGEGEISNVRKWSYSNDWEGWAWYDVTE